jgi:surface protein
MYAIPTWRWSVFYKLIIGSVLLACSFWFTTQVTLAAPITPGSFSTTWKTDNAGTSGSNQITIPTTGGGYNYDVYWEEVGNDANNGSSTGHTGSLTITFPSVGTYRVDITGSFPRIRFNIGDNQKILTVEQWGSILWSSFETAFVNTQNLTIPAIDAPNLSQVTNMSYMFYDCKSFNQPINNWNVENVTSMQGMFYGSEIFNQPINNWNVENVTSMQAMFQNATAFNQPLNDWNVSSVADMQSMFYNATTFNQPLSNWNVSSVADMQSMFALTTALNQPLNNWNVANVTNMQGMFQGATAFNQPLNNWNVSSVANMLNMFSGNNLSTLLYTDILTSWSSLPSLMSNVVFNSLPKYCSTASSSRGILTSIYNWNVTDAGSTNCFALSYSAGVNATLIGLGTQNLEMGGDGSSVQIVPDSGYQFIAWSDGSTDNPRTDTDVTANIIVSATVSLITTSNSGGGGGGSSKRNQNNVSDTATGTAVVEIASTTENTESGSFMDSVTNLLGFLQINQETVKSMPEEEKKKMILLLQSIIAYLMSLLVELKA